MSTKLIYLSQYRSRAPVVIRADLAKKLTLISDRQAERLEKVIDIMIAETQSDRSD